MLKVPDPRLQQEETNKPVKIWRDSEDEVNPYGFDWYNEVGDEVLSK